MGILGHKWFYAVLIVIAEACAAKDLIAAQTAASRIDEALQNIATLVRPEKIGYATFWDGNKYIQCRRTADNGFRCEAAGSSMQPSLGSILSGDRINRLTALGWTLDPSFGNYAQTFPAATASARVADHIAQTLKEVYDANLDELDLQTSWVEDVPCPPRNGFSQSLAGVVNDSPAMRMKAIYSCSYSPTSKPRQTVASSAELIALYGTTTTAEIQRLRVNSLRRVYAIFDAGIGYIQCAPEKSVPAIYCEAQSEESWAALKTVLTSERISRLRDSGYTGPGRSPNYSKNYLFDKYNDKAIASELLTLLYEVYGYNGAPELKVSTE